MQYIDSDIVPFLMFGLSIIAANLSCWRMDKHIRKEAREKQEKLSTWEVLRGNPVLPQEALTVRGQIWRKLTIGLYFCAILFGGLVIYFSYQEWVYKFGL